MNFALASISTQLAFGAACLKEVLRNFAPLEIRKISSVYQRIDPQTEGSLSAELVVVIQVQSEMGFDGFKVKMSSLQKSHEMAKVSLLSFNHEVILDPLLPIPNPDLHQDALILHCAAEIEGGFEHPVLGRSLQELVKSSQTRDRQAAFEFISRGETLLS